LVFLALFGLIEALGVPLLTAPTPYLEGGGALPGLIGVGLLIIDVLLPVPSSLVMIAHGALYGVIYGALLSLIGGVGAAATGFWMGRRGVGLIERLTSAQERAAADALLRRWGTLAIILSRPVPMVAETVAILAGTTTLRWRGVLLASALGNLPIAVIYAMTGASAASLTSSFWIFGLVIAVAGLFFAVGRLGSREEV
ncbi:VTT domain-containing protein, partial [Myxococcota bacterium]|nr:VTT domain-containing protein [Myxococcota bacterium]